MISYLRNKIESFWNSGHERTLKVKRNIAYSFLIKGASVVIGLLLIPLTINYINTVQYGIWLTISSLVAWINNFDIGLGNGLRNKMAHALALNEEEKVVKYVSTTYAIIFLVSVGFFFLFFLGGSLLNWNSLLNVTGSINYNLWPIVAMTLASFCVQFALQPIKTMLIAMHQPFMSSLILLLGQALTFILTYLLTLFAKSNLMYLVLVSAWSPVLIYLLANLYLFATSLKQYRPRFSAIDLSSAKSLLNMGWAFFFLQMGGMILYESDNIVLTRVIGPDAVTTFNIVFKYFYVVITAFAIILTPYWSAFTDAYAKKDIAWIKNSIQKMRLIWLVFTVATVCFYIFAKLFYRLWLGNQIAIPNLLSLTMAVYAIFNMWQGIYSYSLNGMGKLRLQLFFIGGGGLINIPLSILLIHWVGISGTVLANVAIIGLMNIAYTYQVNLIIAGKAKGILNK